MVFKTANEEQVAGYLDSLNLKWEYERQWGTKNPDFTVSSGKEIIAIVDQKDFDWTKEQWRQLKAGKMIGGSFDPYDKTREKIEQGRRQFGGAKEYPCILILGTTGPVLPAPIIAMGAMLGDLAISFPVGGTDEEAANSFGGRGKMLNPYRGDPQNTTITAVGILGTVKPDAIRSGYQQELKKLTAKLVLDDEKSEAKYFQDAKLLEERLTKAGYNLERQEATVTYIINPFARHAFPKTHLAKGYSEVYEYDLATGQFSKTSDWKER